MPMRCVRLLPTAFGSGAFTIPGVGILMRFPEPWQRAKLVIPFERGPPSPRTAVLRLLPRQYMSKSGDIARQDEPSIVARRLLEKVMMYS